MVNVGDPVTVLAPSYRRWQTRWMVKLDHVSEIKGERFASYHLPGSFRIDQEGVRWIRGHHERRSRECQALLAAAALVIGVKVGDDAPWGGV